MYFYKSMNYIFGDSLILINKWLYDDEYVPLYEIIIISIIMGHAVA
jgi:hypothetical protein